MPTPLAPLPVAWDRAIERYARIEPRHDLADFNVGLLEALRPRWVSG